VLKAKSSANRCRMLGDYITNTTISQNVYDYLAKRIKKVLCHKIRLCHKNIIDQVLNGLKSQNA